MKKFVFATALLCFTLGGGASAATVEPDPGLHEVMGGLYALSAAMELYRGDSAGAPPPDPVRLARYFQADVPSGWDWKGVYVKATGEAWWVGLRTPDAQSVRRFLRLNAPRLEIFEGDGRTPWLGGKGVWMRVGKAEGPNAALRIGRDGRPFFGTTGTDWFWGSPLRFTDAALKAVVKARGGASDSSLEVAPSSKEAETFKASPVGLPAEFTVSGDEDDLSMEVGDVRINPIPRVRND